MASRYSDKSELGQPAPGQPGRELARRPHAVLENGGVDVQAANAVRVTGPPVPDVLDPQHRAALLGGDAAAQLLVPAGDVEVRVVQPQCQVDPPAAAVAVYRHGDVVALVAHLAGRAPDPALVAVLQADDPRLADHPPHELEHVGGPEVVADQHHHVQLGPGHEPGHEAAGDQ